MFEIIYIPRIHDEVTVARFKTRSEAEAYMETIKEKKPIQKNIESKNQIEIQKKEYKVDDKMNFGQKPLLSKEINRSSEFDKKKTDLIKKRKSFRSIIRWFLLGILLSLEDDEESFDATLLSLLFGNNLHDLDITSVVAISFS